MACRHLPSLSRMQRQRGAALLMFITLLVMAASYTLLRKLNQDTPEIIRQGDNTDVLGQARAALMGYALHASGRPPGQLPCPDTDDDGRSDACGGTGPVAAGRLPWLDLGLGDLRDSSGERLWYVLARELDGGQPIHSDSVTGSLTLDGTTGYAAIVFAPGKALNGQSRPPAAANNVARYLEDDNADGDSSYVTRSSGDFNDQLLAIDAAALMQATERRVTAMLRRELQDYYALYGYYPYPAPQGGSDCDSSITQGQIPLNIGATCPGLAGWGGNAALPGWFGSQGWNERVWYAVAPGCTFTTPGCSGGGRLSARNTGATDNDKQAIVIAAGPRRSGQAARPGSGVSDLLDSTENTNGDDVFEALPVDAASNDQLRIVAP